MRTHSHNWAIKKLKDLGTAAKPAIKAGPFGSSLKKEDYVSEGYKVYGQEQVIKNDAHFGDYFIDEKKYQSLESCAVAPGDVLISLVGTMGKVLVVPKNALPGVINPRLLRLTLDQEQIIPDFTRLFFEDFNTAKTLKRWSQGGTMDVINADMVGNLLVQLPSILEQTAIANLFSTWDEAIEKTERLIAAKEKRFTSLTQELIHNCAEGLQSFHLRDICEPVTRKNDGNELNVLTTSAQHGLISQMDYYKKSVSAEDVRGYYLLKKGEFAYNRSSSNGYPYGAIKRLEDYSQGVLSTLYLCFSLKKDAPCDSDFMAHAFEAGMLNKQLVCVCQEGARSHGLLNITKTDFFGLKLSLPAITEQRQIAVILTSARQEIDLLKKQADALRRQKRGLMQKMLTGVWRVKTDKEAA